VINIDSVILAAIVQPWTPYLLNIPVLPLEDKPCLTAYTIPTVTNMDAITIALIVPSLAPHLLDILVLLLEIGHDLLRKKFQQ